jgi:hypothetical protein
MSYDYDRTKTAALPLTWGDVLNNWMKEATTELANSIAKGLGKNAERPKVQVLTKYGWMASITAYDRSDMEFDVLVSVSWMGGKVTMKAYTDNHPTKRGVTIVNEGLDYDDTPKFVIKGAADLAKR